MSQQTQLRCCVTCRRLAPKQTFWRVVRRYPSHEVALDCGMGRSAYLCPTLQCLQGALKKDRLSRMLRTTVPTDIYDQLRSRLEGP
ncbi:MAG: YlxR family protein [Alkalinema sp. RU_4_3]|nr:YlxR family protein [Alkalinema sp. RU_4_3]